MLKIVPPESDAMLADWRHVHNVVIPTAALSLDEVREPEGSTVTVIARVLAERYLLPGDSIPFVTLQLQAKGRA